MQAWVGSSRGWAPGDPLSLLLSVPLSLRCQATQLVNAYNVLSTRKVPLKFTALLTLGDNVHKFPPLHGNRVLSVSWLQITAVADRALESSVKLICLERRQLF